MIKNIRNNNFNLLRLVFAILVIVSHVPELQSGNRINELLTRMFGTISFGELAVDSFFVLSGYLIVKSWSDRPNASHFLSSRILRIYPGFCVCAVICAFAIGPLYGVPDYFNEFDWKKFVSGLLKLQLVVTPHVFGETPHPHINGSLWTISYEFKCYLLVLAFGAVGLFKWRSIWTVMFGAAMLGHILTMLGAIDTPLALYFRLMMPFTAGGCFFLYRDAISWNWKMAAIAIVIFLLALFSSILSEVALSIFWGYFIIHYAMTGKALLAFNKFPDVSYGVYLYAWPINKIVLWHYPELNLLIVLALTVCGALFMAILSWYVVEKPFIGLKSAFRGLSTPEPVGRRA